MDSSIYYCRQQRLVDAGTASTATEGGFVAATGQVAVGLILGPFPTNASTAPALIALLNAHKGKAFQIAGALAYWT